MPLSLLNHSALALFAQRTRIPTSARSIGFCAIWVCISSSSSYEYELRVKISHLPPPPITIIRQDKLDKQINETEIPHRRRWKATWLYIFHLKPESNWFLLNKQRNTRKEKEKQVHGHKHFFVNSALAPYT
jgi:PIN domain nuclease of toxin-antitoxin system